MCSETLERRAQRTEVDVVTNAVVAVALAATGGGRHSLDSALSLHLAGVGPERGVGFELLDSSSEPGVAGALP